MKLNLKNTNIFINIENNKSKELASNEINIFKKNEKFYNNKKYKDFELNSFNFQKALIYDKRTFFQYYLSILKYNNLILFSFYPENDFNIKIIKISLFFLSIDIYFFINTLFYGNSSIHKIYEYRGLYNISYFIPQIIYSFIIYYYFISIIKYFSLSQRELLQLKEEKKNNKIIDKGKKTKKCLIIKYICFYALSFIFLSFFWYYLSSFCAVYKSSQFYVIKFSFISLGISLLYPIFFNLFTCLLRITSLNNNNPNECFYKISKFIQIL